MHRLTVSQAAALLVAALPALAQAPRELTVDWIYGDEAAAVTKLPKFAWTTGGDVLLLDERLPAGSRTIERVRPDSGQRSPAVDAKAALSSLNALSPKRPQAALDWPEALDPAGKTGIYVLDDDLYALDLPSSTFTRLSSTDSKESLPRLSPDGKKVAFVRDNDLYVYDLA